MNEINLLYVLLDSVTITLMVLLAIRLVSISTNPRLIFLFVWMSLGIICSVIASRDDFGLLIHEAYRIDLGALHPVFNLIRNSVSGAFMLACHVVFRDGRKLPRTLLFAWILQSFLEEPITWILGTDWNPVLELLLYEATPAVLQTTFLGIALYWIISNRDDDLIPARQSARWLVVIVFCAQAVLSLLVERIAFGFVWVPLDWQYPVHGLIGLLGIALNGILLFAAFSPNAPLVLGERRQPKDFAEASTQIAQDDADTGKILFSLQDEHIYRTPGLSVRGLADHLAIPEYRLRNLVHEQLGFRNFNALLHHYRVAEVCASLEDPKQNTTPVLTLALSAGYQSINPFNRAFREIHGMTPTEYRRLKQKVVES